jgi:predicted AlkP superfamily pyrophosphatase or phosphodiesterase
VRRLMVLDVAGLTPPLVRHMPRLRRLAEEGTCARLDPVLPAVTCSVQSTLLTGLPPAGHGAVGNGWYFRELGDVLLWRQHHRLVGGEKIWEAARKRHSGYTVANVCWWYAMGAEVDWTVTPRPVYYADGRKEPDCYTYPPPLHDELPRFPLFQFWGPGADIRSSRWIAGAARHVLRTYRPDLSLVYIPHLDFDLQRYGPAAPEAARAAGDLDRVLGPLLDEAASDGLTVVVVSEYGITAVDRPVDINRALRGAGLLNVYSQDGMEYLDPWTSRAFAVADHQVAHVYVRDPADVSRVSGLLSGVDGIAAVLGEEDKKEHGLDHPRSGELIAVAAPGAWFTYYYWLDDERAPDFARLVEIHRKPGYDPAELFFDPSDRLVKARAMLAVVRKRIGMRYAMRVVPLDPSCVRGSHGRLPAHDDEAPVFLCSAAGLGAPGVIPAAEVKNLLLKLAELS